MGNTESAPPTLHDNYLAVIASIEGRLGHLPARGPNASSKSPRRVNGSCRQSNGLGPVHPSHDDAMSSVSDQSQKSYTRSSTTALRDSARTPESRARSTSGTGAREARRAKHLSTDDVEQNESVREGQDPPVEDGADELNAPESDWEDAALNDLAEEDVCSLSSPAHAKLEPKQSGVKAPSPRLFPSISLAESLSLADSDEASAQETERAPVAQKDLSSREHNEVQRDFRQEREPGEETGVAQVDTYLSSDGAGHTANDSGDGGTTSGGKGGNEGKGHADAGVKLPETKLGRPLPSKKNINRSTRDPSDSVSKSPTTKQQKKKSGLGTGRSVPEPLRAEQLEYAVTTASVCSRGGFCAEDRRRRTSGAASAEERRPVSAVDLESFSPYSPSYALGITTPTTNATTTAGSTEDRGSTKGGFESDGDRADADRLIFGDEGNHFPFLEEPALSIWVTCLLGKSLAACMAVCPHWLMKINQ